MPAKEYNIGCYLIDRLLQIKCRHLFGVPGDYNLLFLDDVMAAREQGFEWIGCSNELNAAYAADGYARCARFSALLTTYGVGEISALNGVAGAFAERSPVLHIVGAPSLALQNQRAILHHTLGDGNFMHFARMSESISCARAVLTPENAQAEIDRVITTMLHESLPGFLMMPADVAALPCEPPTGLLVPPEVTVSAASLKAFEEAVEGLVSQAKSASLLVGHMCDRFAGCAEEATKLVQEANIPFAHNSMGKATLNEQLPQYVGNYGGKASSDTVLKSIEGADVFIHAGVVFHDFGTAFFSQNFPKERLIDLHPYSANVGSKMFGQVPMSVALATIRKIALKYCASWPQEHPAPAPLPPPKDDAFSANHFYQELQSELKENDIVVIDQGTICCNVTGLRLPKNCKFVGQYLWGSIGASVPMALGAQIAFPDRRMILLVGDGASQMTIQEIGTFARNHLKSLIFLVNNDGYVIERVIHGWSESYNDITSWDYSAVAKGLGRDRVQCTVISEPGKTTEQFRALEGGAKGLNFYEVMLGRYEVPIVTMLKR